MTAYGPSDNLKQLGPIAADLFLAAVSISAAVGFLVYGGRLFLMLQRFPIESRGRRRKLREVGLVTSICAGCFSFRLVISLTSSQHHHAVTHAGTFPAPSNMRIHAPTPTLMPAYTHIATCHHTHVLSHIPAVQHTLTSHMPLTCTSLLLLLRACAHACT